MKPQNPPPPPVEGSKPFPQFLRELEQGHLVEDLSDETRDLLGALSQHAADNGKAKGKLKLELTFAIDHAGILEITADVAVKAPKTSRSRTVGWLSPGNNFSLKNPAQLEIPAVRSLPADPPARAEPAAEAPPAVRQA